MGATGGGGLSPRPSPTVSAAGSVAGAGAGGQSPRAWQRLARKSTSSESDIQESLGDEETAYVLKHLDMTKEDLGENFDGL